MCVAGGHVWQGAFVVGPAWQGACVAGGMHGGGACMTGQRGEHGRGHMLGTGISW